MYQTLHLFPVKKRGLITRPSGSLLLMSSIAVIIAIMTYGVFSAPDQPSIGQEISDVIASIQ